jgi:hypothetical protein
LKESYACPRWIFTFDSDQAQINSSALYTVQGEETERSSVLQLNSPRLEQEDNKEAVRIPSLNTFEDNTEAVKIPGLNTLEDSPITSSRTKHLDDAIADLRYLS